MKIGGLELIVVLVIAILVIGPERTIILARKAGKWLRVLRVYLGSMTEELCETVVEPLQELQEPLKEITQPFNELSKEVTGTVNEIAKPFDDTVKDLQRSTEGITTKNIRGKKKPDSSDNTPSAEIAEPSIAESSIEEVPPIEEPLEEELEMAQVIEDGQAPEITSPAIADIEEAGGKTDETPEIASA
ncbi:MAG: hypothetical protein LUC90_11005 [Lachnospiraceae bacterium]|nr:hypothetical protein [Lachnospiraceae bacterium]